MIRNGEINFSEQPNIQSNPMPNHQAAQVGAVFAESGNAEGVHAGVNVWNHLVTQGHVSGQKFNEKRPRFRYLHESDEHDAIDCDGYQTLISRMIDLKVLRRPSRSSHVCMIDQQPHYNAVPFN